jgi:uncharacterized iron-regulated membrane protein
MAKHYHIKKWFYWHRYTSLICTLFLLILCFTGLPLIFQDEITDWLSNEPPGQVMPQGTAIANLDQMVVIARQHYPQEIVSYVFMDETHRQVQVNMLPAYGASPSLSHSLKLDMHTGALLKDAPPKRVENKFINLMLDMHEDLFLGLSGALFLALMGVLFVISIISGAVLYGPFMQKLDFGTIRTKRSRRLKWLDLHNLLGIATLVWLLVVGMTGIMNEFSTPLFGIWQQTDIKIMLKQHQGQPVTRQIGLSSIQAAYDTVHCALPKNNITSIVYPGHVFSSPHQYLIWTTGNEPLTSRLFTPVLIDARSGNLEAIIRMPWYLRLLEVSRPLHFGDYGGMPLKVIWAIFDLIAIVVLISGVYLWMVRRKFYADYFLKLSNEQTI